MSRKLLQQALKAMYLPSLECADLHHRKKDQHECGDLCKPLDQYNDDIAALEDELAKPETPDDLLRQSEREGWRYAKECEAEVNRLREEIKREEYRLEMILGRGV